MRLACRREMATSGWAGQEVAADEADCAYISAAARLTSLAPTIELGEGGCLVGLLFRRQIPAVRITNLENAERKRIIETDGRALLSDYWGAYIAVLSRPDGSVTVLRDTSRSEEHTSELQSPMSISSAVFCLKNKNTNT